MANKRKKNLIIVLLAILVLVMVYRFSPNEAQQGAVCPEDREETCIACHGTEECEQELNPAALQHSVHKDLPCASCHIDLDCAGIHENIGEADPESSVFRLNVADTCRQCHEEVYHAYAYSFHGTAVELGSQRAATCTDCHGSHDILSPSDPESTVAAENVPTTCSQCHEVSGPNFAKGKQHVMPTRGADDEGFSLWLIGKLFILVCVLSLLKDAGIAILELIRKLRPNHQESENPDFWEI